MICNFCRHDVPAKGYCCEKAELETLRVVADEVIRHLDNEVKDAPIGGLDVEVAVLASARLRQVRVA